MKKSQPRVAVIGAGISGLKAAFDLSRHGFSVTVFEKARGPGGRTSTRRQGEYSFDHGAQYFTVSDQHFRSQVDDWLERNIVAAWKGAIAVIKDKRIVANKSGKTRYVGIPGMNAMSRDVASDLDVRYQSRVETVKRGNNTWHLVSESGGTAGYFDFLVIAVPPAQAAAMLSAVKIPTLSLSHINLQPCWALMLVTNESADVPYDGAFVSQSPLSWIGRNKSKPGRPSAESWILHASPEWSAAHLEADSRWIRKRLLTEFENLTTISQENILFESVHRWRYAQNPDVSDKLSIWDGTSMLGVCGDWLATSNIEGAYLSGRDMAKKIMEYTD
jgi:predicted NAD/FAD-dependent oxidoreductase